MVMAAKFNFEDINVLGNKLTEKIESVVKLMTKEQNKKWQKGGNKNQKRKAKYL
jgi:hypothetical protein